MSSVEQRARVNRIPLPVKIIILVQAAVILVFTVGMYQEYVNNSYLQAYTLTLFSSNFFADLMLSMVTVSVFAIGTFTLLGSMGSTRRLGKEWKALSEPAEETMAMPVMPVLETADAIPAEMSSPRRSRPRRPRISNDDLFASMTRYDDDHQK